MDQAKVIKTVTVTNRQGLHARPVHQIVKEAQRFQASLRIVRDSQVADAKSMLDVLTLMAERGAQLSIEAQGPDADAAVAAIVELFCRNFDEAD